MAELYVRLENMNAEITRLHIFTPRPRIAGHWQNNITKRFLLRNFIKRVSLSVKEHNTDRYSRIILWYTGWVSEGYKRNPNTLCVICNKPIYKRPFEIQENKERIFCSAICYGISCRKEKPCVLCGKPILSGLNKKTCNRSCANKYRAGIKYKVNSSRDKVKAQRSIKIKLLTERGKKCERCGYNKYDILNVHHKDRNRNNNNLDNLELICPNCHSEEHYSRKSRFKKRF